MWNFNIGRTFGLMFSTLPFIALRTAVYFGCSLILIAGFVGGPLLGVALVPESIALYGFYGGLLFGCGVAGTIVYFLREYFLYLVKAGHVAVLVELLEGRTLPKGQLSYAKDIVASRFVEASSFFLIDQVITSVLNVVNRMLVGLGSFLPGMDGAMAFIGRVIRTSLTFADEVILGLSFRTRSTDVWRTSRDGVVLYAQNYKIILKNAFFLAIINYLLVFLVFLMAWPSASWVASLMPGTASGLVAFVLAILMVYSVKKAFIEPFLMAALMQVYFHCIEGQVPNPAWIDKLNGLSDKFRGMTDKFTNTPPQAVAHAPAAYQAPVAPAYQAPAAPAYQAPAAPVTHAPAAAYQAAPNYGQAQEQQHPSAWQSQQAAPQQQIAPTAPSQPMPQAWQPAEAAQTQPMTHAQHGGGTTLPLGLVNHNRE